jgi:hypothetical protein
MSFFDGSDTVYDGTLGTQIYPDKGDAVRVTATGTLTSTVQAATNATFKLIFPLVNNTVLGSVQVTGVPMNATVRFMCQFLMTFRNVSTVQLQATVESNGMIAVANAQLFPNWSPGPDSNVIPINVLGEVDVLVVPDDNLAVSFDQCVIEYLDAPA